MVKMIETMKRIRFTPPKRLSTGIRIHIVKIPRIEIKLMYWRPFSVLVRSLTFYIYIYYIS